MAFLSGCHVYYGTSLDDPHNESRAGGTVLAIRRDIVQKATDIRTRKHQRGCILILSLLCGTSAHFTAVHVNSGTMAGLQEQVLSLLYTHLRALRGFKTAVGDWNFMHMGDMRAADGGAEVHATDLVGAHCEQGCTYVAEIYRMDFTFARGFQP